MINDKEMQAIEALDLEPIKVKLMHKSGESWSLDQASAAEREYRRFLYLAKCYPAVPSAPAQDVDIFWHYHILDTAKYADDCAAIFGYFLHHFPYIGLRGEDDAAVHERCAELTHALYAEAFGAPANDDAGAEAAAYSIRAAATVTAAYSIRAAAAQVAAEAASAAPAYSIRTAQAAYSIRTAQAAYSIRTAAAPAYSIRTAAAAPAYSIRAAAPASSIRAATDGDASVATAAYSIRAAAGAGTRDTAARASATAFCIQLGGAALPDDYATRRPTLADACV